MSSKILCIDLSKKLKTYFKNTFMWAKEMVQQVSSRPRIHVRTWMQWYTAAIPEFPQQNRDRRISQKEVHGPANLKYSAWQKKKTFCLMMEGENPLPKLSSDLHKYDMACTYLHSHIHKNTKINR